MLLKILFMNRVLCCRIRTLGGAIGLKTRYAPLFFACDLPQNQGVCKVAHHSQSGTLRVLIFPKKIVMSPRLTNKNAPFCEIPKGGSLFDVVWGRSPKQTLRTPCLTGCGAEPHKSILRRKAYWPLWNPTIYRRFRRFDGCCLRAFLLYSRVSKNDERKRILSLSIYGETALQAR